MNAFWLLCVTLSLAVSGKFSWREVPGYWAAQLAGAIAGAAAIYLTLGRLATITAGGGVPVPPLVLDTDWVASVASVAVLAAGAAALVLGVTRLAFRERSLRPAEEPE